MGEDIESMDFREAFYHLQTFLSGIGEKDENNEEMYPELPEIYNKARYGIDTKFDAYDLLNQVIVIKGKTGKALYRGKVIDLSELWTELEERTIMMKKWIRENTPDSINIGAYKQ